MYMKRLIAFAVAMAAMASFAVAEMRYGIAIPAGLSEIVIPRGGYMSSEAVGAGKVNQRHVPEDNLTAYSMVTRDGRRLVSRVDGGKTVYELVATNALPTGLPPVREWTIYGIKSAHSDLGLHRSNYAQRKGTVRRLEMAKDIFDVRASGAGLNLAANVDALDAFLSVSTGNTKK